MLNDLNTSRSIIGKSFFNRYIRLIKHIDYALLFLVLGLCVLGLLVIYSSTHQENVANGTIQFVKKQVISILAGLLVCLLITIIDYHEITKLSIPGYVLSLIMLVYVIYFG